MLSQTDAVKQAWAATDRTLDIIVTVDGKDYQATEINSLNYDAGAFTGDTLGIGSTYENSVTIEFSSVVEAFKQGLTVLPKVGILVNGKFEYTKLGTFIISEVNRDRNNNLTTIKAVDQMCKLEGQYKSAVSAMASPLDIIADIANQGGVTVNTGELQHLPTLPNIKKIEGQTLRTAIGWVAQLYGGFAAFDRDGKLTIRTTATPDYTISPSEYQQGGLTKNEVAYKTGGIKVTVNAKKTDDSGQEVDDTTTLQAGETTGSQIELTNDSMTSDLLTTVWTGIKDITYYPYMLNWFGNPGIEAGDWVTLTDTQGNRFNVPINQYTMSFNGGLESTISATQTSSAAGGYAYTGSAGSIKNMIEALQVRHTASGNNVYPPSYQGQPKNPKKGDVWYKQNGNNVEVWIYQEEDGKLTWIRTPLDGEVKAELQALGKKTDEDLTRVKSELSSTAESQWESAKTATSETDQRLTSLQAENNASLADLHNTANSLHAAANSLHADADAMRSSMMAATSELGKDITSTRNSLAAVDADLRGGLTNARKDLANTRDSLKTATSNVANDLTSARNSLAAVDNSLRTATSEFGNNLTSVKNSLAAVDADLRNGISKAGADLANTKTSLTATGNSLATATSELQRQTGQISGSLSTADSMIMFNSNAIAEVKRTAGEISTTVSNIRVGGRNLLTNTRTLSDVWHGETETVDGFTVAKATQTQSNTDGNYGEYYPINWRGLTTIKPNTDYVLTFYAKASKQTTISSYFYNIGADGAYKDGLTFNTLTTDYQRFVVRFHTDAIPSGRQVNCLPVGLREVGVTAWIYGVQLEEGNTATQWQPNPEDTDQAISKVSQTADAIRADLTNTKGDVASVKAKADSLTSSMANANGQIGVLQQRADSLTSTLSNGGTNLLSGTRDFSLGLNQWTPSGPSNQTNQYNDTEHVTERKIVMTAGVWQGFWWPGNNTVGHTYTLSFDARCDNGKASVWQAGLENNFTGGSPTLTTNWIRYHYTGKVTRAGQNWVIYFQASAADNVYVRKLQIEYGDTPTPWNPSSGDISTLAQTASELTSRISNTEGDVSGLQQTAKSIQASVADNKNNISSVKQTATALQSDLSNAKGDISTLKQTASGLTSRVGNAEGHISELQQTASGLTSTVSNLHSGDRNYVRGTSAEWSNLTDFNNKTNYCLQIGTFYINDLQVGDKVGFGITFKNTGITSGTMALQGNGDVSGWNFEIGLNDSITNIVKAGATTTLWKLHTMNSTDVKNSKVNLQVRTDHVPAGGTLGVKCVYIKKGTLSTDWTPAPEDADSSISQIKQIADRIQAQVNDNKGNISSVTQTANAVKTDLANTKGDVSSLRQTANKLTSDMVDAKGNISSLQQTATGLQSTVQSQSGQISQLQQDAKELTATVADGGQNLILNSGNPSTLDHWWATGNFTLNTHQFWKNNTENLFILSNTSSTNEVFMGCERFAIEPNQDYTLSFYAFNNGELRNADVWYLPRKSGSSKDFDTAIILAPAVKFSAGNAQYVKLTFNSGDYNEGYIRFDNNGSTTEGAWACLYLADIQLEKGKIATAWSNSPGDIAQLKITADGLTSKVADTQGNVSSLQQTATMMQKQIADNNGNISAVKNTADEVRTDLTNANHDIFTLKSRADSLTSSMTNAQEQISTLQQRADSITTTLSQGGNNLLNNSQGNFQPKGSGIDNWQRFDGVTVYMTQGKNYTVSAQSADGFVFSGTHDTTTESNRILLWLVDNGVNQIISSDTTDISMGGTHFTWNNPTGTYTLRVNSYKTDNSGYAHHVQIEYGDTATPWKPSNGDISSLQQTASQLTSDIKDAKGNISTLQQTAGGLTSRVGNAEENISSVQQTAKDLKATVGDSKSGLVSTVNAMPGKITSAITASKQATVITWAVDLHNMTTAGYYLLKGSLTNSPVDAWAFLRVITSDSGDRIYHRIWKDNGSTVYTEEWTGSWSSWATHINSDNLKSNVITAINQSTEGVSITGNKITLDGNVNVAPGFTLSADYIKAGTLSADRISGGTLNFSNITVNGLTANSISSGSISGQNLNINLDNGVVEFTKGNLHSTDGGFNISIDTKSFYLDMGNNTKLWIDGNGFHLQESDTQHLWLNKDGLHNYTTSNSNGVLIQDSTLSVLNNNGEGLVAQNGLLQFSTLPTWLNFGANSTLTAQAYGIIGPDKNLFGSSKNGLFVKGREGVVIGTNSYNGETFLGSLFNANSVSGSGISLSDDMTKAALFFTKAPLILAGGPTWDDSNKMSVKPYISVGSDWYYSHNGAYMNQGGKGTYTRGNNIIVSSRNTNIIGYDWINFKSFGRIALDADYVHSYPTYLKTTSAGANVFVAPDGALIRSSSARKYKTDIQEADNDYGNKLIEFTPQKWIDKAEKKRYEEDPENNKKPGYYYGLIADDLDAAGLNMLVNYGAEGEVEGINYDRLVVALLPVIKSLKDQVASLKKQIKALAK